MEEPSVIDRLAVRYRVTCPPAEVAPLARSLALEQSVEVPLEAVFDPHVREHVVGRVEGIASAVGPLFGALPLEKQAA